ncbi:MAG TPA: ParB/RepB/Spo0J family partition protein [Candidatus Omnitrophota bacterium]|nr:ParB/RepB/Spo0J family partition protein [Candidatus Omnitrophota bacterium]HQL41732.1 ParB/RepB/Spo0J family partition protein [Candidatus Omnitrophota bacterium]
MEKSALGKGLSALIPENVKIEKDDIVTYLPIAQIKKNAFQPRKEFNEEKLSDLISSIKEKGVLQPLLVRRSADGYELIAGERRLRAAQTLNIDKVPVIVKTASDQEALVLALIENIQREELNPIEESKAYQRLIEDFNFTQDLVAQSVGKDRSTVTNMLRLLSLPEDIQKSVSSGSFSVGHARALLSIRDESQQKVFWKKTTEKGLSVRELENIIKSEAHGTSRGRKISGDRKDPYVVSVEEELQRALGTKVRIAAKKKRGKIIVEYYSNDDLERITKIMTRQ